MIIHFITAIYLSTTCGSVWCMARYRFPWSEVEKSRRLLLLFTSGHALAMSALYFSGSAGGFVPMCVVSGFPLVGWAIWQQARRFRFQGDLNVLYIGVLLCAVGLFMHYRVGSKASKLMAVVSFRGGVPVAVNLALFDVFTFVIISELLFSGRIGKCLSWIERRTSYTYWGIVSIAALTVPVLVGGAVGRTKAWLWGASGQVSEFGLKLLFPVFLSFFLERHQKEISIPGYPARELGGILVVFLGLVSAFFLIPLVVFQREQGSALLIGLTLMAMVTFATRRWYTVLIGLLFLGMAIFGATLVDPHTKERIFGAWIDWAKYVRHPFPGSSRFPGWHIATVRAVVESASIYGSGIGQGVWGRIPAISTDFAVAPLLCELGIIGLVIVMTCYLLFLKEGLSGGTERDFKGFLRVSIPVTICCQGFFQIWAVLGIAPLAGVPLPMISNGGSAAVCNTILLAVLTELGKPREIKLAGDNQP